MQEMIKRIIDMDKKAQEITEAAQREKLETEKSVSNKAAQLREEYLSRARHRIKVNKEMENANLEKEWTKTKARYDDQITHMDELYNRHGDEWVNTIVKRVLNG